ncbi:MAG: winged helix-turn-helix domain-containing protein [Anaerolineae bacterium]|nr:winged helix-turn-helix domain-containing protein [Anaerolineae bacterium]
MPITVDLQSVRRLAVVKQGLHQRPAQANTKALKQIIRQIGLLQLDSISITARSHYLVMLSRAGVYDPALLDALLPARWLFEQWAHAACLIPMEDYPYFVPRIRERREALGAVGRGLSAVESAAVIEHVLEAIRAQGPLSARAFEGDGKPRGTWWDWKPAKAALEHLFDHGVLMVDRRENFQRYYDLAERVLAGQVFEPAPDLAAHERWAVLQAARAQGVATLADLADYYRLRKKPAAQWVQEWVAAGELLEVRVEGWKPVAYLHRADLPLLEAVQAGAHPPQVTTFLSPFDNLIWYRPRAEALWNFSYRVEMYTPAAKRTYGYYVLPILQRGVLVGRLDPKIERKDGRLIVRALHLEPGQPLTAQLVQDLAGALREFMVFMGAATWKWVLVMRGNWPKRCQQPWSWPRATRKA